MIYGYDIQTINEHGLKLMREISISTSSEDLRSLADFLAKAAEELEGAASAQWHKHAPDSLRRRLDCDVIVLNGEPAAT